MNPSAGLYDVWEMPMPPVSFYENFEAGLFLWRSRTNRVVDDYEIHYEARDAITLPDGRVFALS